MNCAVILLATSRGGTYRNPRLRIIDLLIGRVRALARLVAQAYHDSREKLGFPLLAKPGKAA